MRWLLLCSLSLCCEGLSPLAVEVTVSVNNASSSTWRKHDIRLAISGGVPPYHFLWNHNRAYGPTLRGVRPGLYDVDVWDSLDSQAIVSRTVIIEDGLDCPALLACMEKQRGHAAFFIQCLRKVASPLMWDTSNWDLCAARALLEIAMKLHVPVDHVSLRQQDYGAMFVGVILAEALTLCETTHGIERCDFSWDLLLPIVFENASIRELFEGHNVVGAKDSILKEVFVLTSVDRVNVVIIGPYAYDNEPVFSPFLAHPSMINVTAFVVQRTVFPSSFVRTGVFPWTLQVDVELAALFVMEVLKMLQPSWVFAGDNGGVLVLAKLAHYVIVHSHLDNLTGCLKRSMTWPPVYPPPVLSKLIPGHEEFSPQEFIVSDDDGKSQVWVDESVITDIVTNQLRGLAYLKREYSEAGIGVSLVFNPNDLFNPLSVFMRKPGIAVMDLSLTVRVFLQKAVMGMDQYGVRAFVMQGRVVAMAASRVLLRMSNVAVSYETVRNFDIESAAIKFFRTINFTGFGTLWFLNCPTNTSKFYLFDFNARIERHVCLGGVLLGPDSLMDPCYVFQQIVLGLEIASNPAVVPGGYIYVDPIRVARAKDAQREALLKDESLWNVNKQDTDLMAWVRSLCRP